MSWKFPAQKRLQDKKRDIMNVRKSKKFVLALFIMMCCLSVFNVKAEAKKIYTGNTRVDCAAEKIIRKCTKPSMSPKKKMKAVYTYLVKNMTYSHRSGRTRIHVTKQEMRNFRKQTSALRAEKKIKYSSKFSVVYDNLLSMRGTCRDMSGVLCVLANHLGYRAGYVTGRYIRRNGTSIRHWWSYVIIDGKKYYWDVQAANYSWKKHHSKGAMKSFCLKTKKSRVWRRHHR